MHYPIQASSRKLTDLNRSLGIQGYAQHCLIFIRFLANPVDFIKDRIGLRDIFQWTTFFPFQSIAHGIELGTDRFFTRQFSIAIALLIQQLLA